MRKRITKSKLPYGRIILMGFIIFCVAVLVWDVSHNGFSAAWGALPSGDIDDISQSKEEDISAPVQEATSGIADDTKKEDNAAADFASLRLEREQARAEELALLDKIIADKNTSPAILADAEKRRLEIASDMENEIQAEAILTAKNYGETVVMLGDNQATVIVDLEINEKDAAIIADIVDKSSGCGFENVVIVKR